MTTGQAIKSYWTSKLDLFCLLIFSLSTIYLGNIQKVKKLMVHFNLRELFYKSAHLLMTALENADLRSRT